MKLLSNGKTRNVSIVLLPLLCGGLFSWLFSIPFSLISWFIIAGIIVCVVVLLAVIIANDKVQAEQMDKKENETNKLRNDLKDKISECQELQNQLVEDEKMIEELQDVASAMQTQIDIRQELISLVQSNCFDCALALNDSLVELAHGKGYGNITWNKKRICESVCNDVLLLIKKFAIKGRRFSASYTIVDSDGCIRMIAYKGIDEGRPSFYPHDATPRSSFSATQFRKRNAPKMIVLRNPAEIKKRPALDAQQKAIEFQQYIGIPISYNNSNSLSGYLEVIAYKDSEIALSNSSDLQSMAAEILSIVGRILLLISSIDRTLQQQQ